MSTFDGPYMQAALKALRPAYTPPSRRRIGNKLLEEEYKKVMADADDVVKKAPCLTLMPDGWTNQKGDGIVNFVVGTPKPLFLNSVEPGKDKENADYLFKQFDDVIQKVGAFKVLLIVTDNARALRNAWKLIQGKYPHIYVVGCGSHCLNLLNKDIFKITAFQNVLLKAKLLLKLGGEDKCTLYLKKSRSKRRMLMTK